MTFFECLLLGHFVGDYLLQNSWMALNKTKKWLPLLTHVCLYTLAVCLFTCAFTGFNPLWILVVIGSHLFIDRWSLADKYLEFTGSRSLRKFVKDKEVIVATFTPSVIDPDSRTIMSDSYVSKHPVDAKDVLAGGFTSLVYVCVDNTMHVLLMVLGAFLLKFIGG